MGTVKLILEGKVDSKSIEKVISILKVCDEANYSSSLLELDPSIIKKMSSLILEIDKVLK